MTLEYEKLIRVGSTMHIFRIQRGGIFDIVSLGTWIAKGVAIVIFFAVRYFKQRRGRPVLSGEEEPLLGPDTRNVPT